MLKLLTQVEVLVGTLKQNRTQEQLQKACELMRQAIASETAAADVRIAHPVAYGTVPDACLYCPAPERSLSVTAELPGVVLPAPLSSELQELIKRWDFNIHMVPEADLPALCFGAITLHESVQQLPISRSRLWNYIQSLAAHYRSNPFHNFRHGVDVCLSTSFMIFAMQRSRPEMLSKLQILAQLVGAIAHDVDHPGVMNGFLTATDHPLALLYNSRSVLENHHAATCMALLSKPETNFTLTLAEKDAAEVKKTMVDLILLTDVSTTMPFVKGLNASLDEEKALSSVEAMTLIIKASDISNPSRTLPTYEGWIQGVMQEFYAQGDAERSRGLPITMNCDRHTVNVNKCQVGFIAFLVGPLFECLKRVIPDCEVCHNNVQANKEHFEKLANASL